MPLLSSFFGIIVYMYWEKRTKHSAPHFHAIYNEYECVYHLPDLVVMRGKLPPRADRMVRTWAKLHIKELIENWDRVLQDKSIKKIKPLE
ncbi:MAG: hypothetical protein B6D44_09985 [Ignavibacteriales bacterium UTCHB2]|jgi:hypothetical protein|nr:MAG: hypothetical protein B6D44_09985 [Ignavibacteriales bacterium UTCHB2]